MASLTTRVSDLATRIGTEFKTIRTLLTGSGTGTLAGLSTTQKTSLVAAINEVVTAATQNATNLAALVSDTSTDTTHVLSASKVLALQQATKDSILGGAGTAYDTLFELKGLLDASDSADDAALDALNAAIGNRLRVDAAQGLTAAQQATGRGNLDVFSKAEIGTPDTDLVAVFTSALA